MKDIFTDLYNKVLGFFRQTENKQEEESAKDVACNRLKFVLMQDRTNLSPELMDRMRKELIDLLSKYVEMDKEALELGFEQEGSQMALMLSIPVVRAKEEAEIEAILAKEDEENAAKITATENGISDEDTSDNEIKDEESDNIDEDSSEDAEEAETESAEDTNDTVEDISENAEISVNETHNKKSASKKEEKETVASK